MVQLTPITRSSKPDTCLRPAAVGGELGILDSRRLGAGIVGQLLLFVSVTCVGASEPLHQRIDAFVAARFGDRQPAIQSDDSEFLRRVWLDLAGVTPTAAEARAFFADVSPGKRNRLIERLLTSSDHQRHLHEWLHTLLMERRGDHSEWQKFLERSVAANKPWNLLVQEILDPSEQVPERVGAAFFIAKRLEPYGQVPIDFPGLTRDVGRLFLGVDLQCAQCHDHLFIEDYRQRDFQGLYSVFLQVSVKAGGMTPALVERPQTQKLEFVSVFNADKQQVGPRVPFRNELALPATAEGAAPASALQLLAGELTRADNPQFSRNIVNRLWCLMLGRGLVHPLDLHHAQNPASHPELLDLLADEFAAHNFDIRWLLGELARTETYQRSGERTGDDGPPELYLAALEKRLSPEQLLRGTLQATGERVRLEPAEGATPTAPYTELKNRFLAAYANEPRDPEVEYLATVKASLFVLNDTRLLELLVRREGNLLDRLAGLTDADQISEELYLSVFSRLPTVEERAEVREQLSPADQREARLARLLWAMLASTEFVINH